MQVQAFRKVHPVQYHLQYLNQGVRPDGRGLLRARKTLVSAHAASSADGSAMVRLGHTLVIAGVQVERHIAARDGMPRNHDCGVHVRIG